MRVSIGSLAVACATAVLAVPLSAEDLTIVFKDGKGATETHYYTSGKMRHASSASDTIMDFSAGTITTVDHKKKQYSQVTLAEIEAAMKQASAQMEQQMASLPPQVREKMEQMMGGAAGSVTVTKGGTKKVAGYDTQQYTVTMGENLKTELWNTTALALPFDPAQFRKMASFATAAGPMVKSLAKMAEKMQEVQGLTLAESTSFKMMGRTSETSKEAVEVKQGAIAGETFAVPAGYKQVESPTLKAMGGRK